MIIKHDAKAQLIHQLRSFYIEDIPLGIINDAYPAVLDKINNCFTHVKNKYYNNGVEPVFDSLHLAQWTMFLYEMSNHIYNMTSGGSATYICDMIYGLEKIISSADIFYAVNMPNIYFFDHPQGSVMGRAQYADYFTFSQGCTVGNNKGKYPVFEKHVSMLSNSKVLGDCRIGDHVIFSANSYVIDVDIPPYSIVFGSSSDIVIKPITLDDFNKITGSMFDGNE